MRIGIDIDSTLNTLDEAWCEWIIKTHDPSFSLSKWTEWSVNKLTTAGTKAFDFLSIPGSFRYLGVRDGAKEAVKRLEDSGHELFVVSSCDPARSWGEKHDWVREHFNSIPKHNLIACSRKGLLKLDVLIDDGPHNFKDFDGRGIIFDQPWNRHYAGERILGWGDINL